MELHRWANMDDFEQEEKIAETQETSLVFVYF